MAETRKTTNDAQDMKATTPEEYETKIAELMAMNARLQLLLTRALEEMAEAHKKNRGVI